MNNDLYKKWKFPCGEVGIALTDIKHPLVLKWAPDTDIFEWLQAIDAYKHHNPSWDGSVSMPYFPYSRQDKVHHHGESSAFHLLLKILEVAGVKSINTFDLHCHQNKSSIYIYTKFSQYEPFHVSYICYADENACNHGFICSKEKELHIKSNSITFHKIRDNDGSINLSLTNPVRLNSDNKNGVIINDDICDGGGTFIEAAKKLKKIGFGYIELFVTHGFFTKGLDCLYEAGIDKIITTNTVCKFPETYNLKIIKVC